MITTTGFLYIYSPEKFGKTPDGTLIIEEEGVNAAR